MGDSKNENRGDSKGKIMVDKKISVVPPRILIVDDEPIASAALSSRLEKRGFEAVTVLSGKEALRELGAGAFDGALLDIVMPEMSGIELLEKIRARFSKDALPAIMVTALDDSNDVQEAFQKGATDYILKPVNIDAAAARIHAHIDAAKFQRESLKRREISAVHSVAITYNHEINNPLMIAVGGLANLRRDHPEIGSHPSVASMLKAFDRIAEIVRKIDSLHKGAELSFEDYAGTKMVKVK